MAVCLSIISKKQTLTWSWSSWMMLILILQSTVGRGNATWQDWWDSAIRLPTEPDEPVDVDKGSEEGTRWAVLVAGSSGYANYRHQADVCHAYQLPRRGGVKEENIVVFMNDDIATDELNPRPGVIINRPQGQDVYAGLPKVASQIR